MDLLIETAADFTRLVERLRNEPLIAVDSEAASFHRHADRVYLLQVSTRVETWIVDPLAVPGLPGFEALLADPGIELVFHDADYDLRLLRHEFGYRVGRVFDTRLAAQFLNEPGTGLATLLEKYFRVRLDKRFQRADWSARPLDPAMLSYAATDTRHLPELRDLLHQRLVAAKRLAWVEEECELLREVRWPEPEPPEVAALRAKGARVLTPRALAVYRELYVWREHLAAELDRAAFRIVGNETLIVMAQRPPRTVEALRGLKGLGREVRERYRAAILAAIDRGLSLPDSELPRFPRSPRHRYDPAFHHRLERLKLARVEESARLDLPPGVLAPNWLLESIARAAPGTPDELAAIPGIRRWQQAEIGARLIVADR